MDLRQLEYVVGVVDHGGFTRAAAALHVSQPSLSHGVQTLERELGVELFHRLGRQVALTSAGEAVVGPAPHALRQDVLAVCPPGTHVGRRRVLPVARLAGMPLVTTPPGTSTRRLLDEALASADITPRVAVEAAQREALLPLVLAGAGTSFLPRPMARAAAEQ